MSFNTLQPASAKGADEIRRDVDVESGKASPTGPKNGQFVSADNIQRSLLGTQDLAVALAKSFPPEFGMKNPEMDQEAGILPTATPESLQATEPTIIATSPEPISTLKMCRIFKQQA
jgi:hypothetical protein